MVCQAYSCLAVLLLTVFSSAQRLDEPVKLKIKPVFHQSLQSLKAVDRKTVKCQVIDSVLYWLSQVLRVRNGSTHSLPFDRKCSYGYYKVDLSVDSQYYCRDSCSNITKCGPVTIPENHLKPCSICNKNGKCWTENATVDPLSEFQDAHYVLYVSAIADTLDCNALGSIVSAGTCQQDRYSDRPVAGYLNFCPGHLGGRHSFTRIMSYVLQELIGALGFSESLLPFFRDPDGKPLMPRSRDGLPRKDKNGRFNVDYLIAKTLVYTNWTSARPIKEHTARMITLPHVVAEAQAHFGCPNMTGMPLEDNHSSKLLWESRILWGEMMTSTWDKDPILSRITLALLEDTGWYYPRYRYGFDLFWGRGKGCSFVNQSCMGYVRHIDSIGQRPSPFCTRGKRRPMKGCNIDHTHLTSCVFSNYSHSLPRQHTYWKFSSKLGGNVPSSDYCPFFNLYSDGGYECSKRLIPAPFDENSLMRLYPGSKCIETSQPWKILNKTSGERYLEEEWGGGCYQVKCNDDNFDVYIGDFKATCNATGQLVPVKAFAGILRYTGEIICPSYEQMCPHNLCHYNCLNGGQCYPKRPQKCYCTAGFQGPGCYFRNDKFYREDDPTCDIYEWDTYGL